MELPFRFVLVAAILFFLFGVALYFCFKGMARQLRRGHVDRLGSGKTVTGLGLTFFITIVPIALIRHDWLSALGFGLLFGAIILIGHRGGEPLVGRHRR